MNNGVLLCAVLCALAAPLRADDTPAIRRARSRIEAVTSILARTTNTAERTRWEERLELEQRDLENRLKRIALEDDEAALARRQHTHALYVLRESIRAVDSDADAPLVRARRLNVQVLDLRKEHARMQEKRERLESDPDKNQDALVALDEEIRNLDELIVLRSLERDAAEMESELSREADRINTAIDALPINPDATIRLLNAKRRAVAGEKRLAENLRARMEALQAHRGEIATSLALARARLAQIEDEIEIEAKRRRLEKGKSLSLQLPLTTRNLLTFGPSGKARIKELLETRVETLEGQLGAVDAQLDAAARLLDLYGKEIAVLEEDLDATARRFWTAILMPLGVIAIVILLHLLLSRRILPLVYRKDRLFLARRLAGYLAFLLVLLVLAFFFLEDLKAIATVLGIAGAALVIALQDLCSSFAGWFVIVASRKLHVGDRVEIDGQLGDVLDIQLLRVTLLELHNWLGIDEPTGRIIVVPNSFIFKSTVFNFSHVHPYVWSRIDILVTFETPALEAQALLKTILETESRDEFEAARAGAHAMERHYGVPDTTYEPKLYSVIADSGVQFTLLYVSHYRRRTEIRNRINARIIAEFEKRPDLNFAYPTQRHIPTSEPGRFTVNLQSPGSPRP
ncbi:MAG: mechanosensitive ion channel [Lentisphaerae bacterium]|nr:mechanosensitive ion channel [Lentisphaerota bacterium]